MPAPALPTDPTARALPALAPQTACAAALDRLLPLKGASHRDAAAFDVDVPLRYAECLVELADGTRVRLGDRAQLLGWSGQAERRQYWFRVGMGLLRLRTVDRRVVELQVFETYACCAARSHADPGVRALPEPVHRVTGIDGGLLFVAPRRQQHAAEGREADHATARRAPAFATH